MVRLLGYDECFAHGSEGIDRHLRTMVVEGLVESVVVAVTSPLKQKPARGPPARVAGFSWPGAMMCFPCTIAPLDLIDLEIRTNPLRVE